MFITCTFSRGADGTIVRDMDRGPPLKVILPEDGDDIVQDDDMWYEDEEDAVNEEKQLEELAKNFNTVGFEEETGKRSKIEEEDLD